MYRGEKYSSVKITRNIHYNSFSVIKAINLLEKKGKINHTQSTNLLYRLILDLLLKETEENTISFIDKKVNSFINYSIGKYYG